MDSWGQRHSLVVMILALNTFNHGSIPATIHGPPRTSRSDPWVQSWALVGVAPPTIHNKNYCKCVMSGVWAMPKLFSFFFFSPNIFSLLLPWIIQGGFLAGILAMAPWILNWICVSHGVSSVDHGPSNKTLSTTYEMLVIQTILFFSQFRQVLGLKI